MKKTLLLILILILAALLVPFASAHPGKTDGNGGHTDQSTGEYHYHHGYPAHDHYDMDGDGYVDCPYQFKDKTNTSSSANSNGSGDYNNYNSIFDGNDGSVKIITKTEKHIPGWIYWIIAALMVTILVLVGIINAKREEIKILEHNMQIEKRFCAEGLNDLQSLLIKNLGKNWLCVICGAKNGDFIGYDDLPHSSSCKTADRYTFFFGSLYGNSKYHHLCCQYSRTERPVNAYNIRDGRYYQACSLCSADRKIPDMEWVNKYKKNYAFLSQYIKVSKKEYDQPQLDAKKDFILNLKDK